jgi:flagellar basal-body rod modification protein FlgD
MSSSVGFINTTPSASSASGTGGQTLDQADFLQLLVTQMSSQDPLNPESDTDFAAQLAQFSSLQETQDMQSDLQNMQATGLIGATVTVKPSSGASAITGVVSSVQVAAGTPSIIVDNQPYALSQISAVTPTSAATPSNGTPATSTPSNSTPTTRPTQSATQY